MRYGTKAMGICWRQLERHTDKGIRNLRIWDDGKTGERDGKCSGYVTDHIHPGCAGCADNRKTNMQCHTVEKAKAKNENERRMCRNQKQQVSSKASPYKVSLLLR